MRRHLYFYTYVDRPYLEAVGILSGDPGVWLPEPAVPVQDGFEVMLDAGATPLGGFGRRDAIARIGSPSSAPDGRSMLRGIGWRALERDELFPVFEGDLELAALSDELCQLSCMGSYRPPLTVVGAVGDRLVGHRVAEAVVRNFVLSTAGRVADAVIAV